MKIICISGKARSGKDTSATLLQDYFEEKGKKVLVTHYADLLKFILKNFFNWNGEKDEHGRHLLQYVGTDIIRNQQPDYWVDFLINLFTLLKDEWDIILIPDARFPNEVDRFKESGFDTTCIRIERPFNDNGLGNLANHSSETSMDCYDFDKVFCNLGTINDLKLSLIEYFENKEACLSDMS